MAGIAAEAETGLSVEEAASALARVGSADDQSKGGAGKDDAGTAAGHQSGADDLGDDGADLGEDGGGELGDDGGGGNEDGQGGEPPAKVRLKTGDGKDVEVTLDELARIYEGHAAGGSQLEEQRRAAEAELLQARQQRGQYAQVLERFHALLGQMMPQEPDWAKLRAEDPQAYAVAYADWHALQQQRNAIAQEHTRVTEQATAEQATLLRAHVDAERKRASEIIPGWADETKAEADRKELYDYGRKQGFTHEELSSVFNARQLSVLWKANAYDKLQARRGELRQGTVTQSPASLKPGASQAGQPGSQRTRAIQRLERTGSVEDAAAALAARRK